MTRPLLLLAFLFSSIPCHADEADAVREVYEQREKDLVALVDQLQKQINELQQQSATIRSRLPKDPPPVQKHVIVFVISKGSVEIRGENIPLADLKQKLKQIGRVTPSIPLTIEAPKGTLWKDVQPVIHACLNAGLWNFDFNEEAP